MISYTIGTKPQSENNPSLVIDNFKNYFLSHAMSVGMEDGTAQEKADELWKSIVKNRKQLGADIFFARLANGILTE